MLDLLHAEAMRERRVDVEGFIGNLLVIIIVRELGPLVTALIVISLLTMLGWNQIAILPVRRVRLSTTGSLVPDVDRTQYHTSHLNEDL